jgi:uncharacterized protein YdaU (DUF1376 family)
VNYYSHHIGDFDRATRHLTRIERSIYRDLLDVYYETEQPITLDLVKLKRKILANSEQESTAVEQVLNEFFTETPSGWFHSRCDEEILAYWSNNSQKSNAGKASAAARATRKQQALNGNLTAAETNNEQTFNGRSTDVQRTFNGTPTNQEPITNNQEPITNITHTEQKPCVSNPVDQSFEIPFAAVVCQAMRKLGMADVNPGHPKLLKLIEQGASLAEFEHVATKSIANTKGFAYALGMLAKLREEAAAMPAGSALTSAQAGTSEPAWRREQRERTEKAVPGIAAKNVHEFQKNELRTFDAEVKDVTAIAMG